METITSNTKRFELTGEKIHVHFTSAFSNFWVRNDGSGTVLVSLSPNIEDGKDGVIEVPAGSSAGTGHGFEGSRNDLYLLGSGKVQVMGTGSDAPYNPFSTSAKGGGDGGGDSAKPVNYILLYGLDVQGIGDIRVDYKYPLTKSGIENLCVIMSEFREIKYSGENYDYNIFYSESNRICPFSDHVIINPYNTLGKFPTKLSLIITEPD